MTLIIHDPKDVAVIGAGISGLATARCLLDGGFKPVVLERTPHVGGLWQYTPTGYGVMAFTHINVTKQNYAFSDYPFPDETPDFPHHTQMAKYINNYTDQFKLRQHIRFETTVTLLKQSNGGWELHSQKGDIITREWFSRVAIASGHHASPILPNYPGQDTFKGKIIHSVAYKDFKGYEDQRVLVVGIGNSAIDAAVNVASVAKKTILSTRSGAWIIPNYVFGYPVDHYACRFLFSLPITIWGNFMELIIRMLQGDPYKLGLNPKARIWQTQPTVSSYFVTHIARQQIHMRPGIKKFDENGVFFLDGTHDELDAIIMCTGYKISLPYIDPTLRNTFVHETTNVLTLYKNVFVPEIGSSLAFIGFVQPTSGGVISMAECQARWFVELCRGTITLPSIPEMHHDIKYEIECDRARFFGSERHTIQRDPIAYNDMITDMYGAKPKWWRQSPAIAWKLLFGTSTAAQWRLQGPNAWPRASEVVKSVPIPRMSRYVANLTIAFGLGLIYALYRVISHPMIAPYASNLIILLRTIVHMLVTRIKSVLDMA